MKIFKNNFIVCTTNDLMCCKCQNFRIQPLFKLINYPNQDTHRAGNLLSLWISQSQTIKCECPYSYTFFNDDGLGVFNNLRMVFG